jgi:Zn-dependent protease with chaperone function
VPQFLTAWHYDGESAVRRTVEIVTVGNGFLLSEMERRFGPFQSADLRYIGEQNGAQVYGLDGRDGWRLGLSGPIPAELAAILPAKEKYGRWIDRLGLGRATIALALGSAAIVGVVMLAPQWLAPLIPSSFETQLGEALVGDFGGRFCHTPQGTKALKKLASALDPNTSDLQVEVAKIDMVNAVALPGRKVVLFDGLLREAKSADEVAGVMAHEIGHVRERHVMQSLLRQLGLSLVLGGLQGNSADVLGGALSMSYSRGSENEADRHSIKALAKADISPIPTADFFRRLAAMEGDDIDAKDAKDGKAVKEGRSLSNYLSSHPQSRERKAAFEKSIVKGKAYKPVLTETEWRDLRSMCTLDTNAKSGFGFEF